MEKGFKVCLEEIPFQVIRTKETLASWILRSLGLGYDEKDIQLLLLFMKGGRYRWEDIMHKLKLSKNGVYKKLDRLVRAGIIYRAKGGYYQLRERKLSDVIEYKIKAEVEKLLNQIETVARELEELLKDEKKKRG